MGFLPCPILKIEKSSLILQKIPLILEKKCFVCVHIYGLNSHKKAVCWVSRTKNTIFSPVVPFFVCRTWGVYWSFYFYSLYFSIRILFHRHWRFTGQQGKGGDHLLLYSITSSRSPTLRHLFATLHVRWQSRIFDRNACAYQTYHLIELSFDWLIDDGMFVYLLDELILGFCFSDLTWENGEFQLASTITLVLQANRLTKCASVLLFQETYPPLKNFWLCARK